MGRSRTWLPSPADMPLAPSHAGPDTGTAALAQMLARATSEPRSDAPSPGPGQGTTVHPSRAACSPV